MAPEAVRARQWRDKRCVGVVTWVEQELCGIKLFEDLHEGTVQAHKYVGQLGTFQACSMDVVSFEVQEESTFAINIFRLGKVQEEAEFVAVLLDADAGTASLQSCCAVPHVRCSWYAGCAQGARSGDIVAFTLSMTTLRGTKVVGSTNNTEQGTCEICCDDETLLTSTCTDASHKFCLGCIQQSVTGQMGDLARYPIKCIMNGPGCSVIDSQGPVRHCLTEQDIRLFDQRTITAALGSALAASCTHCGHVQYATLHRENGSGVCESCQGIFCRTCGQCDTRHLRMPCMEYRAILMQEEQSGNDDATSRLIESTSKPCPQCGYRTTHWHGHSCHHIRPGGGCPNCHTHWCYVCGQLKHRANPDCHLHGSTFCRTDAINDNIEPHPYPHDRRCGCPICNICRPGAPCDQCDGDCVVCLAQVPPGPMAIGNIESHPCPHDMRVQLWPRYWLELCSGALLRLVAPCMPALLSGSRRS